MPPRTRSLSVETDVSVFSFDSMLSALQQLVPSEGEARGVAQRRFLSENFEQHEGHEEHESRQNLRDIIHSWHACQQVLEVLCVGEGEPRQYLFEILGAEHLRLILIAGDNDINELSSSRGDLRRNLGRALKYVFTNLSDDEQDYLFGLVGNGSLWAARCIEDSSRLSLLLEEVAGDQVADERAIRLLRYLGREFVLSIIIPRFESTEIVRGFLGMELGLGGGLWSTRFGYGWNLTQVLESLHRMVDRMGFLEFLGEENLRIIIGDGCDVLVADGVQSGSPVIAHISVENENRAGFRRCRMHHGDFLVYMLLPLLFEHDLPRLFRFLGSECLLSIIRDEIQVVAIGQALAAEELMPFLERFQGEPLRRIVWNGDGGLLRQVSDMLDRDNFLRFLDFLGAGRPLIVIEEEILLQGIICEPAKFVVDVLQSLRAPDLGSNKKKHLRELIQNDGYRLASMLRILPEDGQKALFNCLGKESLRAATKNAKHGDAVLSVLSESGRDYLSRVMGCSLVMSLYSKPVVELPEEPVGEGWQPPTVGVGVGAPSYVGEEAWPHVCSVKGEGVEGEAAAEAEPASQSLGASL